MCIAPKFVPKFIINLDKQSIMAIRPPTLWNVHVCLRLYVHVIFINFSHITVVVNVSYTAALQTVYQYQVLTKTLTRISRREKIISTKLYKGSNSWLMNSPPRSPSRLVHRSQTINRTLPTTLRGSEKKCIKTVCTQYYWCDGYHNRNAFYAF